MSLFESSVHPSYNPDRLTRSLRELDDIISARKFTQRDAGDPMATKFRAGSVPTIPETASYGRVIQKTCSCVTPETPSDLRTVQTFSLSWDPAWTVDEIEAEESRRVCWNALAIISIYNTLCVCHGSEPVNFWLANPGNVSPSLRFNSCYYRRANSQIPVFVVIPRRSDRSRFSLIHRVFPIIVAEGVRLGTVLQEHASVQLLHASHLG